MFGAVMLFCFALEVAAYWPFHRLIKAYPFVEKRLTFIMMTALFATVAAFVIGESLVGYLRRRGQRKRS